MNVHWRPYYAACSYCDLQYNFISKVWFILASLYNNSYLKIEDLGRDMEVIFGDILNVPLPKEYHANQSNGASIQNKTSMYLGQLSADTRGKLYQVYKHDFKMFGYTSDNTDPS